MIRAIVFDFDGVLVESVEVKTKAFAHLFAGETHMISQQIMAYHLKNLGVSRFEKFRTIYRDILKLPLTEEKFRSLCKRFSELVVDEVVAAPWVEGAERFLQAYGGLYPLFVISGTPEEELREIVRRRRMEELFMEVMGSPKTKDILLRETMERHRLAPTELVFIGDAETDWKAALETGVTFVWRRADRATPSLPGFLGLSIVSLAELEACLLRLGRQEVVKR